MLSGICTAWGNGEVGNGRCCWLNVAFVGVGVVADASIGSSLFISILTGLNAAAMVGNDESVLVLTVPYADCVRELTVVKVV